MPLTYLLKVFETINKRISTDVILYSQNVLSIRYVSLKFLL